MRIAIEGNIKIAREPIEVFTFLADLKNDQLWRKEINRCTMQGPPALGVTAEEDSFLSRKCPSHLLHLVCKQYEKNKRICYETITASEHYLKSTRTVLPKSEELCLVSYQIEFDTSIVKKGLGFELPTFITKMVAKRDMRLYLKKLKKVLES